MGLWRYAADGVRHNGRRTFSSILGVLLAITFVSGTLIAIDSSTRATLDALLIGLPGDLSLTRNSVSSFNVSAFRDNLQSLAGIKEVSLYRETFLYGVTNGTPGTSPYMQYADLQGIDPARPPSPVRDAPVTGTLDVPNGSAAISSSLASSIGVRIGDTIRLTNQVSIYAGGNYSVLNYTVNLTVSALIGSVAYPNANPTPVYMPTPAFNANWVVVNLRDMGWILQRMQLIASPYSLEGQVWIDRLYYVNPYDTAASKQNIARLVYRIQSMLFGYGFVTDNLSPQLDNFQNQMTFQRLEFLVLSAPVILLGLYLGAIGVDLSHAERRRELAILKTRGASRSQVVRLLLTESVFGGIIAAVLGLAAGILLSRFLLGVVNPFAGVSATPGEFLITRDTVLTVVILSVALMAVVTFRSARRTAALPVVETLRYYAPGETKVLYNPRTDIILLAIGIAVYGLVVYQILSPGNLFTFLIGGLLFLLLPFMPILIIIGTTRLATRSTARVYAATSRVCEPLAKNMHHIIRQNLVRNPRRASSIAIIIALGLGFGMFTLSYFASSQVNQAMDLRANLGADVVVQGGFCYGNGCPRNPTDDPSFQGNLSAVAGVGETARLSYLSYVTSFISGPATYYGGYQPLQFYGVEPRPFFNVTQPESWYFSQGNAADALAVLERPGQVLVTQYMADQVGIVPGSVIPLTATFYNYANGTTADYTMNVTVGGFVRALPGLPGAAFGGYGYFGYGPSANIYAVYGSHATFSGFENASRKYNTGGGDAYMLGLGPGADWRTVKQDILSLGASNVQVYQEQLDMMQNNIAVRSTNGFMAMEVAFIVVILTAGLCLILYAATLERDTEFAAIIARGATGWQTAGILVGEGFSILLVGLAVGAGIGILTAYIETLFLYAGIGPQAAPLVPLLFVLPPEALLLLALAPVAMFVGALVVSLRIAKMNVAKVLKMRGG